MIKTMLISASSTEMGGEELIEKWRQDADATLWLDLEGLDQTTEKQMLLSLDCHPLAIQDTQRDRHPPKVELFENYIFLLYRGFVSYDDILTFEHLQLGMFIGHRILITCHAGSSIAVNNLFNESSAKYLARSPVHLALQMFHSSCGNYLKQLFTFESHLEKIEDQFQLSGNDQMMREITAYRSQLVKIRRTFNYHVSIGESLSQFLENDETSLITPVEIHTLTDLRERLERLMSLSQMYYEICGDLIDGYMSVTSHQLNATMRVLTVITALFVPLTFLAGIYGMNFEHIPELKWANGYFILLGVMLVISVGLIVIFKRKKWL
ncbi:magnesium transporter CorA family protein [Thalassotalea sp. 1_MG-2023]|nr:magnesium transporter CorA family protein [Thalassotalea sp. 1_MG-2023]